MPRPFKGIAFEPGNGHGLCINVPLRQVAAPVFQEFQDFFRFDALGDGLDTRRRTDVHNRPRQLVRPRVLPVPEQAAARLERIDIQPGQQICEKPETKSSGGRLLPIWCVFRVILFSRFTSCSSGKSISVRSSASSLSGIPCLTMLPACFRKP